MKSHFFILITMLLMVILGCTPQPQPIDYGNMGCDYCKMTIVDKRYAGQLVTDKGKAYNFDAIECMINFSDEHNDKYAYTMVTDYNQPATLIDANNAYYVRSASLPSPMGMYITATANMDEANNLSAKHNGQVYSWEELNSQFKKLPQLQAQNGSMKH